MFPEFPGEDDEIDGGFDDQMREDAFEEYLLESMRHLYPNVMPQLQAQAYAEAQPRLRGSPRPLPASPPPLPAIDDVDMLRRLKAVALGQFSCIDLVTSKVFSSYRNEYIRAQSSSGGSYNKVIYESYNSSPPIYTLAKNNIAHVEKTMGRRFSVRWWEGPESDSQVETFNFDLYQFIRHGHMYSSHFALKGPEHFGWCHPSYNGHLILFWSTAILYYELGSTGVKSWDEEMKRICNDPGIVEARLQAAINGSAIPQIKPELISDERVKQEQEITEDSRVVGAHGAGPSSSHGRQGPLPRLANSYPAPLPPAVPYAPGIRGHNAYPPARRPQGQGGHGRGRQGGRGLHHVNQQRYNQQGHGGNKNNKRRRGDEYHGQFNSRQAQAQAADRGGNGGGHHYYWQPPPAPGPYFYLKKPE